MRVSSPVPNGLALIFDLDGVVIDSMPMHLAAWESYLERLGIEHSDFGPKMHGRRNDDIVAEFIGGVLSSEEIFAHGAAKEALFREMMAAQIERHILPGLKDFLYSCASTPIGLASNAEPANVDFVLDGAGLRKHFHVIVDGHQVERPKPFPDVYLRAARLLGIDPKNCIVFEDSPTGIAAARAAGTHVVGIGQDAAALPKVDLLIRDFSMRESSGRESGGRESGGGKTEGGSALQQWLRTVELQS
ncbi:MAG: HAD family phosphatase [Acidobacteriota bacterium]|nr:HAD family phosphatase [Acidobacteriota bacterium]